MDRGLVSLGLLGAEARGSGTGLGPMLRGSRLLGMDPTMPQCYEAQHADLAKAQLSTIQVTYMHFQTNWTSRSLASTRPQPFMTSLAMYTQNRLPRSCMTHASFSRKTGPAKLVQVGFVLGVLVTHAAALKSGAQAPG